mmetsp:Transcript_17654/g.36649  ORF Transcript_17654/g.36649 Transcript_17654/m.36649 type:complete len:308 (-) Transcript_17654:178-1101(-)
MISTPNKTNVQMLNSHPREVSDDDTELGFFLLGGMSPFSLEETRLPVNFSPVTSSSYNHFPGISPPNIRQLGDVDACFSLETTRSENYKTSLFYDGLFIADETSANCIHSPATVQSNGLQSTPTDCPQYSPFRFDNAPSFLKKLELSTTMPITQTTSASTKMRVKVENDSRESNHIPDNQRPSQHKFNASTTCAWMKNYNALKQYVDLNGHCNIMQKEVWWNEQSECLRLGNWVNKQRGEYRKLQKGDSSTISKERIDLLEKIGFQWATPKGQENWEDRFNLASTKKRMDIAMFQQNIKTTALLGDG